LDTGSPSLGFNTALKLKMMMQDYIKINKPATWLIEGNLKGT
jgi:hypothetical protein